MAGSAHGWTRTLLARPWLLLFVPVNAATSGFGVVLPLLVLVHFHGTLLDVSLAAVLFNVSVIFASMLWGHLSDRFPRRRAFLLLNFGAYAVGYASLGLLPSLPFLFLAYTAIGLVTPAGTSASNLLILEKFPEEERPAAFASFQEMSILGGIAGVLAGFVWLEAGGALLPLVYLFAALAAVSCVVVMRAVDPPAVQLTTRQVARNEPSLASRIRHASAGLIAIPFFPRRPRLASGALARFRLWAVEELRHELPLILAAGFLFNFSASLFNTSYTPYLYSVGLGGAAIFLINVSNNGAQGIAFPFSGRLSERLTPTRLVGQATYVRAVSYLGLTLAAAAPLLLGGVYGVNLLFFGLAGAAIALYSTSSSLILFRALARRDAGTTLGLSSALGGAASVLGAFFSGVVSFYGSYRLTFLVASVALLASLPLWTAANVAYDRRQKRKTGTSPTPPPVEARRATRVDAQSD
ncbi:MAG: MFS transporter [Thermoplasmata archaeon]|nr:MFS transporter [Thermoplasmata archaeon]